MPKEEKDTAEKGKEKKGGKSKIGLVLVIVAVLLVLGGGGFVAYKMFLAPSAQNQVAQADAPMVNAEDPLGVTQKQPVQAGVMYEIPTFVVNLSVPSGGMQYLKIAVSLEVPATNKKIIPEIETALPKIKDLFITILSAKTLAEISTSQGKVSLKQELLRRINSILTSGKVIEVYVTDFVIQG